MLRLQHTSVARVFACSALVWAACRGPREIPYVPRSTRTEETVEVAQREDPVVGQAIVICGRRVDIGAPVVLWTEPPGYDASSSDPRFAKPDAQNSGVLRFTPGRVRSVPNPDFVPAPAPDEPDERSANERMETQDDVLVSPNSTDPTRLREVVDQFVLHFDVCGLSRTCFRVLQDERILSVHFLLDVDGTLYQTLDLRDMAWHATKSNPRSIGVEIAQIGAYSPREAWRLGPWYAREGERTRLTFPERIASTGIRTPGFVGYAARPQQVVGRVQGQVLHQYDFTREQYDTLARLTAALCREFPRIRPDAPRDEHGFVVDHVLDDGAWREFHGVLGHYHVQENKVDPGPAFDWETFLAAVRDCLQVGRGG